MKARLLLVAVLVLLMSSMTVSAVECSSTSSPATIVNIEVDGMTAGSDRWGYDMNDKVTGMVKISSTADLDDAELRVYISGYEYNDRNSLTDFFHVFDIEENVTYVKRYSLLFLQQLLFQQDHILS